MAKIIDIIVVQIDIETLYTDSRFVLYHTCTIHVPYMYLGRSLVKGLHTTGMER